MTDQEIGENEVSQLKIHRPRDNDEDEKFEIDQPGDFFDQPEFLNHVNDFISESQGKLKSISFIS